MKLEFTASILASLLVADPVVAQVLSQRQKKERILDSDLLQEKEDANKLHLGQYHTSLHSKKKKDNVHYRQVGDREKKKKIMNPEQSLVEFHDDGHFERPSDHDDKADALSTGAKEATASTTTNLRASHTQKQASDDSSDPDDSSSIPDVGILAADYIFKNDNDHDNDTAVARRNLQTNKKKKRKKNRKKKTVPQTCLEELPAVLTRGKAEFTPPYCDLDQDDESIVMGYWIIQNGKSFFFGGYCTCGDECPKATTTRCCARACLLCDKSSKHSAKCGQFTQADFST